MRVIIRELFETIILALLIFVALQFSIRNYQVDGPSMRPTLEAGEYVLVNKLVYLRFRPQELAKILPFVDVDEDQNLFPFHPPERGDVIIFRFPKDESRDFVKRVVGIPGDTVEIARGQPLVNGQPLEEPYIKHRDSRTLGPVVVPARHYYVLGDNRLSSDDSRNWGTVPLENVIGRAWVSFWPIDRWRALHALP